ncbi:MAG: M23 family metallopeptidase [Candidatus Obscuribacterales bacterium]|nr:M23 family metallopeptidase [Steroidobacteraceae bacterium]
MNVIVFSKRIGRTRQIELTRPFALTVAIVLVLTIVGGAFFAGLGLGTHGLLSEPTAQVLEWTQTLETQRVQVLGAKQQLQEKLDALASRVGLMNAHVIRLDALGKRLTDMANLNKGEFNFDRVPAQGGPEGLLEGVAARAPDLMNMLDDLMRQIQDRERQLAVLENLIATRNLNRKIVPNGRPVTQGWISSYFGSRADPFDGRTAFHKGVDFAAPEGSEVVAVASGVVTWSRDRFGYGRIVEINHGNGLVTRYAHNQRVLVNVGDTVQKGQPIALIGSTGRSTGPHLHFEVLKGGRAVNPMSFIGN